MPDDGYCVFEAVNRKLEEVIIVVADHCSLERLAAAHREYPPVWMAKWEPGAAEYRWVACSIPQADAAAFAKTYSQSESLKKLKVHIVG